MLQTAACLCEHKRDYITVALMPAVCFPAASCFVPSLKIIVSVAQTGTSSAGAAPLRANISPALTGGAACVYLPRLARAGADQRVLSFFFCGFWQPAPDSSACISAISRPDVQSGSGVQALFQPLVSASMLSYRIASEHD